MELLIKSGLAIAAPVIFSGGLAGLYILFSALAYILENRTARGLVNYIKTEV